MGELAKIAWLRQRAGQPSGGVGIGDDSALLTRQGWSHELAAADMLIEGVHFDLNQCTLAEVGRKAIAVNLSDIAAMAGTPTECLVTIAIRPNLPDDAFEQVMSGLLDLADQFNCTLVGGDTCMSPNALVISVTVLGRANPRGSIMRSGAKPGDVLLVTGPLGYSLDGKHLTFTPRVLEAQALAQLVDLHAMIDLSDGLSSDVRHLCRESNARAILIAEQVPIRQSGPNWNPANNRARPLDHALHDGEDFELLFAVSEQTANELLANQPLRDQFGINLTAVGRMIAVDPQEPLVMLENAGQLRPLEPGGFEHHV